MSTDLASVPASKGMVWAGRILTVLSAVFLLFDGAMKLVKPAPVIEATKRLGYPESVITGLGIVLMACTLLYLLPRTSVLAQILLTGYLGGAVASHLRAGDPPFPIVFPVLFGVLLWGGLWLREPRLRAVAPFKK